MFAYNSIHEAAAFWCNVRGVYIKHGSREYSAMCTCSVVTLRPDEENVLTKGTHVVDTKKTKLRHFDKKQNKTKRTETQQLTN